VFGKKENLLFLSYVHMSIRNAAFVKDIGERVNGIYIWDTV